MQRLCRCTGAGAEVLKRCRGAEAKSKDVVQSRCRGTEATVVQTRFLVHVQRGRGAECSGAELES